MLRKFVFAFVLIALLVNLFGCSDKLVSIKQSKKNFKAYHNAIQTISDAYGLELTEKIDINIENQDVYKDLCITVNENAEINIRILNTAVGSEDKGFESFNLDYIINDSDSSKKFDIGLFVDLINSISGREISFEFCSDFLDAPESEYAAEDYGFEKLNGEIVAKVKPLDFSEEWNLWYIETSTQCELSFGGLTLAH